MKEKKFTLQITIALLIPSFFILFFLQFSSSFPQQRDTIVMMLQIAEVNASSLKEYLIIIFGGVFTSSLVVLCVSIGEYQVGKRRDLENYFIVSNEVLKKITKVKYLDISDSEGVSEESLSKIHVIMEQYIEARKALDYSEVDRAYGKIDFFMSNSTTRKQIIYNGIHKVQRDMVKYMKEETWHFENYFTCKEGNIDVMLDKISEIQNKLYEKKEDGEEIKIYKEYEYKQNVHLHKLLKVIYGKKFQDDCPDKRLYIVQSKRVNPKLNAKEKEK